MPPFDAFNTPTFFSHEALNDPQAIQEKIAGEYYPGIGAELGQLFGDSLELREYEGMFKKGPFTNEEERRTKEFVMGHAVYPIYQDEELVSVDAFALILPFGDSRMDNFTVDASNQITSDLMLRIAEEVSSLGPLPEKVNVNVHRVLGSPKLYTTSFMGSMKVLGGRYRGLDNDLVKRLEFANTKFRTNMKDGTTYNLLPNDGKDLLNYELDQLHNMGKGMDPQLRVKYKHPDLKVLECHSLGQLIGMHNLNGMEDIRMASSRVRLEDFAE